ncbi:ferredoxin [Streptomyces sp. CRN 30]|uniref:ferredoxin n=1 Tax=Streptomyces sp. CRN 30 TaxID=3075613 RepID=UPI002A7FBBC7|nr:ferredoxin [Streptomyces sp. CRN 30]
MASEDRISGDEEIGADRERCVGAGQCVLAAPDVFDQDDTDGRVRVLEPRPPAARSGAVREAVRACPSGALSVR